MLVEEFLEGRAALRAVDPRFFADLGNNVLNELEVGADLLVQPYKAVVYSARRIGAGVRQLVEPLSVVGRRVDVDLAANLGCLSRQPVVSEVVKIRPRTRLLCKTVAA